METIICRLQSLLLNSFQNKYLYYAIDDLLYQFGLNSNLSERDNLLLATFIFTCSFITK
jgi:hypothetical protein